MAAPVSSTTPPDHHDKNNKVEESLKGSFPGSDAPSSHKATGREAPSGRIDRLPPKIAASQLQTAGASPTVEEGEHVDVSVGGEFPSPAAVVADKDLSASHKRKILDFWANDLAAKEQTDEVIALLASVRSAQASVKDEPVRQH